jgi:sec-independent protein translocase protein TatB
MSFLGMGTFEILIILLVAFIFLGPERMIEAARTLGKWTGELRRMGSTVQAEMDDLTNIGDPLASRRPPTQTGTQEDASETPLDQDHPTPFRPRPAEDPESPHDSERTYSVNNTSPNDMQPSPKDTPSTRKEESA